MLQRLHRIGSGCGLEIRGGALVASAAKSRPGGVTWLGSTRIEGFRERPAAEWGREIADFLSSSGIAHVAANLVLPREDVIVRVLQLPPMSAKELAAAVRYQLDGLHPYADDEVYFTFARLQSSDGAAAPVATAIAEKRVVDEYADLLEEAGLAVASFSVPSSALYAALRVRSHEVPRPLLVAVRDGEGLEVYGESEGRPLLSADFNLRGVSPDRALQLSLADLRPAPDETVAFTRAGDDLESETPAELDSRSPAELFPTPLGEIRSCPRARQDVPSSDSLRRRVRGLTPASSAACSWVGRPPTIQGCSTRRKLAWKSSTGSSPSGADAGGEAMENGRDSSGRGMASASRGRS